MEAVVIGHGNRVVDLGPLDAQERIALAIELRSLGRLPDAPDAGFGGVSTSGGLSGGWMAAGAVLLALSGMAGFAFWHRRRTN